MNINPLYRSVNKISEIKEKNIKDVIDQIWSISETLLTRLLDNIKNKKYTHLLAEDVWGRVPWLFISWVVNKMYDYNWYNKTKINFFVPSWRDKDSRKIWSEYKEKLLDIDWLSQSTGLWIHELHEQGFLIVADTISSWQSLFPVLQLLKREWISFDAIILGSQSEHRDEIYDKIQKYWLDENIHIGINDIPFIDSGMFSFSANMHGLKKSVDRKTVKVLKEWDTNKAWKKYFKNEMYATRRELKNKIEQTSDRMILKLQWIDPDWIEISEMYKD